MFFIPAIKVNIKSLAAESIIIRKQSLKTNDLYSKNRLLDHKRRVVRPEARLANLAYAFMTGKKRSDIERKFAVEVDPNRLLNKINRFSTIHNSNPVKLEQVFEWLKS